MHLRALDILRCPFCGGSLNVDQKDLAGAELTIGTLWCECSAFPVVDGIPVLRSGTITKNAVAALEAGRPDEARLALLGKPPPEVASFEEGLRAFAPGAEGDYLLYRFSDPSFVVSDALLRTIGQAALPKSGRVLDACGGTGHLTRALTGHEVWVADLEYWKLWLAKRFIAPEAQMVCCDANQPLPFAPKSFGLAFCSDAINYIWQRRLFAHEMLRLTAEDGLTLFTHVHNALCENPSPGMPLSPSGYQQIFEGVAPAFFSESALLESIVGKEVLPLAQSGDVSSAPAMAIVVSSRADLLRSYALPFSSAALGEWRVNPLFEATPSGESCCLTLKWPNEFYEAEFREAKSYLPEQITIPSKTFASLTPDLIPLAKRRVLLDLPKNYLGAFSGGTPLPLSK